jgi:hypothetical protein
MDGITINLTQIYPGEAAVVRKGKFLTTLLKSFLMYCPDVVLGQDTAERENHDLQC